MSLAILAANATSIIFAAGGIWLASLGREGWGWCFFVAAVCHTTGTFRAKKNE